MYMACAGFHLKGSDALHACLQQMLCFQTCQLSNSLALSHDNCRHMERVRRGQGGCCLRILPDSMWRARMTVAPDEGGGGTASSYPHTCATHTQSAT